MANRAPRARGRKRDSAKLIIGVEVPKPTRPQLAKLKKVFAAKAVAILGLEAGGAYNQQQPMRKRRR